MQSSPIAVHPSSLSGASVQYHSHVQLLPLERNKVQVQWSSAKHPRRQLSRPAAYFWQQGSRDARSGIQDAQEKALAAADRQAKQELYEQLLAPQLSSRSTEVSTSEASHHAELPAAKEQTASTELIFRLERRGEGWGEEIFPHLVIERRPIKKRDRNRSSRPPPWTVIHWQASTLCAST